MHQIVFDHRRSGGTILPRSQNRFDTLDAKGNTPLSLQLNDENPAMVEKLLADGAQSVVTMTSLAWRAMGENGGRDTRSCGSSGRTTQKHCGKRRTR